MMDGETNMDNIPREIRAINFFVCDCSEGLDQNKN